MREIDLLPCPFCGRKAEFVMGEDLGRITCGNAILSGTLPDCLYEEV